MSSSSRYSIVVLGPTGRIGSKVISILEKAHPEATLVPFHRPAFEFDNADTYEAALSAIPASKPVRAAYLIVPLGQTKIYEPLKRIIDLLVVRGTKRLVLLTGIVVSKGELRIGEVQAYLDSEELKNKGVTSVTVRPASFCGTHPIMANRDE